MKFNRFSISLFSKRVNITETVFIFSRIKEQKKCQSNIVQSNWKFYKCFYRYSQISSLILMEIKQYEVLNVLSRSLILFANNFCCESWVINERNKFSKMGGNRTHVNHKNNVIFYRFLYECIFFGFSDQLQQLTDFSLQCLNNAL